MNETEQPKCSVCGQPADGMMDVKFHDGRQPDFTLNLCVEHSQKAYKLLDGGWRHFDENR